MDEQIAVLQNGIFLFPEFLPNALCCFSTREYEASRDIPLFLDALGIPRERFATVEQVHGDKVIRAFLCDSSLLPEADGMVSGEKDLALVIRTADCVPVFFFDPGNPAVGICHAGWRGAKKGIISGTLKMFRDSFGSSPPSMMVAIGPAICERCYEVREEFKEYFPGFVRQEGSRYFFDLVGVVKRQLLEGGIRRDAIRDSSLCTSCSVDQFFSARKEGVQTGRLISAAVLK